MRGRRLFAVPRSVGVPIFLQFPDQLVDGRSIDEAERDTAVLALHRMMQPVCLVDALEVALAWNVLERPALMHQPVMKDEVEKAVNRDAERDPGERPPPCFAGEEEQYGNAREHH